MDEPMDGTVRRGELLTLQQRSVRRRDYQLRRGDRDLGRLRFAPGRRSLAQAETDQTGALVLTEAGRRGTMVIRTLPRPYGWRRSGRWNGWTIGAGEADLLRFTAAQGFRSWVQITVQQDLPEGAAVLLSIIGGFLALRRLQAEVDGTAAAVAAIVAADAGAV